jgi:hypothetical protein
LVSRLVWDQDIIAGSMPVTLTIRSVAQSVEHSPDTRKVVGA